jgi:hypothetical protein
MSIRNGVIVIGRPLGLGLHLWQVDQLVPPPPEIVRQALTFILENWTKRPLTTSGLFFIPRTVVQYF